MTNIKEAVKESILADNTETENRKESAGSTVSIEIENTSGKTPPVRFGSKVEAVKESEPPKKRRRGRPAKVHKLTKLHTILENRGMSRRDLYELVAKKYPDEPISPDAISRIVSGSRKYYSTITLFRICGALNITPNMALNWEEEVV